MKRFSAWILAALLLTGALISPVLADSTRPAALPPQTAATADESAVQSGTQQAAAGNAEEEQEPLSPVNASPAGETAQMAQESGDFSAAALQAAPAPAADNTSNEALRFETLRGTLEKYNTQILYLQAMIADKNSSSINDAWDGITNLDGMISNLTAAAQNAEDKAAESANADISDIYRRLADVLRTNAALLKSQLGTLQGQYKGMDDALATARDTLTGNINQIIKGAETLYIAVITMESAAKDLQASISTLDRAVAITEKRQELGMASAYDVETIKHQRTQAVSGLESLRYNIKTNKVSLEGMCGMPLKGSVQLAEPEIPTKELLAQVSYDKNLAQATGRNTDVMNAQTTYDRDGSSLNKRTLQAAVNAFAPKFKAVCLAVPEQQRLVDAAQETVDYQQRTLSIAEQKYKMGLMSREEYLAAEGLLDTAEKDLHGAKLDLLSAYRNYVWATQYGIV